MSFIDFLESRDAEEIRLKLRETERKRCDVEMRKWFSKIFFVLVG